MSCIHRNVNTWKQKTWSDDSGKAERTDLFSRQGREEAVIEQT